MSCIPTATPRLLEWNEKRNPTDALTQIVRAVVADKSITRPTMADAVGRAESWMGMLKTLSFEEVAQHLEAKTYVEIAPDGVEEIVTLPADHVAAMLVSLKTVLQGRAAGLQATATQFLQRMDAGESAFEAGRRFARQSLDTNQVVDEILERDRELGQGLLLQKIRGDGELKPFLEKAGVTDVAEQKQIALRSSTDILTEASQLLNSGDPEAAKQGLLALRRYAELIRAVGSPEKALDASLGMARYGDMLWTVAINGLLSGPKTIVTNMFSFTYAFGRPAFQIAGALPTLATGAGPGGRKAAREMVATATASMSGALQAFPDALNLGWQAIVDSKSIYGKNEDWALNVKEMAIRENGGWNAINFREMGFDINPDDTMWGAINNLGWAISGPSKLMAGGDEMIKHITWRGQMHAQGMRNAITAGIDLGDKAAIAKQIADQKEIMFDPGAPNLRDKWEVQTAFKQNFKAQYLSMEDEAQRATFQEENDFATGLYKVFQHPIGRFARPFMPFVRTPTNILKAGFIESTGIGAAWKTGESMVGDRTWNLFQTIKKQANESPEEYYRQVGMMGFTTVLLGTLWGMASSGNAIGGGPGRWDAGNPKRKQAGDNWLRARREQGFPEPYSLKFGDMVVPMGQFGEPFNTISRMVIDMTEAAGYMTSTEQDEGFAMIAHIAMTGLFKSSYLSGIDNFIKMMPGQEDPDGSKLAKGAQNYARTFLPFGSLVNYVETLVDPYKESVPPMSGKDLWADGGEFDSVFFNFMRPITARIPGFSDKLPDQIDPITGEQVPIQPGIGSNSITDMVLLTIPFFPRGIKQADNIWELVHRADYNYKPWRPAGNILTPTEDMAMNARTKDFQIGGKTKAQAIKEYLTQPEVLERLKPLGTSTESHPEIVANMRDIGEEYDRAILNEMIGVDPQLQERIAHAERLRAIKRDGEAEEGEQKAVSENMLKLRRIAGRRDQGLPPIDNPPVVIPTL